MDSDKFGKDYIRALKSAVPDRQFPAYDPAWLKHWEDTLIPHAWNLIQKEDSFFNEPREVIPGVNFSEFWGTISQTDRDTLWRHIQMSMIHAFLDGDPELKMDKLMSTVKAWWSSTGREDEEISKLLDDEDTPSQFKALLDAVLETRLVVLLQEIVSELDFKELGIDIEHPETLLDSIRDPESPLLKRMADTFMKEVERRIASGRFRREELVREIERIRALIQQTFGRVLNEQLFGGGGGGPAVPAQVYMGTGPEARRQRMLARLQKKQRDKNSDASHKR